MVFDQNLQELGCAKDYEVSVRRLVAWLLTKLVGDGFGEGCLAWVFWWRGFGGLVASFGVVAWFVFWGHFWVGT